MIQFNNYVDKDSEKPAISMRDLRVMQGSFLLSVDYLDLYLRDSIAVVGRNGAGKSTLVNSIFNIGNITSGSVSVFGSKFDASHHHINYIPQRQMIDFDFPIQAIDVVIMGLYREYGMFGRITSRQRNMAVSVMKSLRIDHLASKCIGDLSCGQQQLVFLARMLVADASIYVMDEPFNNLDIKSRAIVAKVIQTLVSKNKLVICIHHETDITDVFNRVIKIENGHIVDDSARNRHARNN